MIQKTMTEFLSLIKNNINFILFFICISFILIIFISACNGNHTEKPQDNNKNISLNKEEEKTPSYELTVEEKKYIEKLRKKGKIIASMREDAELYYTEKASSMFRYNLLKEFADYIGVELEIRKVTLMDYFTTDDNKKFALENISEFNKIPPSLTDIDIYTDIITELYFRDELIDFINIIPVQKVVVTRKRQTISSKQEIKNKIVGIIPLTYSAKLIKDIEEELDEDFNYVYKNTVNQLLYSVSEEWDSQAVVLNSATMLRTFGTQYDNLNTCFSIGSDLYNLGAGVKKEDKLLASILSKFIIYTHKTGIFDELWKKDYNYSFLEYLEMVGL